MKIILIFVVSLASLFVAELFIKQPQFLAYDDIIPSIRQHYISLCIVMTLVACLTSSLLKANKWAALLVALTNTMLVIVPFLSQSNKMFSLVQYGLPIIITTIIVSVAYRFFWLGLQKAKYFYLTKAPKSN